MSDIFGLKFTIPGPFWFQLGVSIALLGVWIWSLFWIAEDAVKRGKGSLTAVIFAITAGFPLSFVWWLWLRPPLLLPPSPRRRPPKLG
jgi:hypothetical protein